MKIKKVSAVIATCLCAATAVQGQDRYITFNLGLGGTSNDIGGTNTIGGFSNADTQGSAYKGVGLTYGLKDNLTLGGMPVSTEFTLNYDSTDFSSASFPGAPNPFFIYDSKVKTLRIGASFWTPIVQGSKYRTEMGVGLGAAYRDISTFDGVVQASGNDWAPYGLIGARHVWEVTPRGRFSIGLNLIVSNGASVSMETAFGGVPAGDYKVDSTSAELAIGYTITLGN